MREPTVQSYMRDVLDYLGITQQQAGEALERILGPEKVAAIRRKEYRKRAIQSARRLAANANTSLRRPPHT